MGACLSDCCEPLYSQSGKDGKKPERNPAQSKKVSPGKKSGKDGKRPEPEQQPAQSEDASPGKKSGNDGQRPEPEQDSGQPEEMVTMDPVVVVPQAEEGEPEDQDEVEVAGESNFLRVFAEGNILTLTSVASKKSLRIVDGKVEGTGGLGKKAQFMVHVRRKGVVALQNVKDSSAWLKIDNDTLSGDGTGDEFCDFQLSQHVEWKLPSSQVHLNPRWSSSAWQRDDSVALKSVKYPGQHVGINPDGEAMTPSHTGTGTHGRFTPTLIAPTVAGDGELLQLFETGNVIILNSVSSGKSLRILNRKVDGNGGKGEKALFVVHVRRKGVVSLQNVEDPGAWLRIAETQLQGNGDGGRFCEFKVKEVDGSVVLESVVFPGQHVGILPDGEPKPPDETGRGEHGRFTPIITEDADAGDDDDED